MYEVKLNNNHYCFFKEKRYAENFVRAQKEKTKGGGTSKAWAAEQNWSVEKKGE